MRYMKESDVTAMTSTTHSLYSIGMGGTCVSCYLGAHPFLALGMTWNGTMHALCERIYRLTKDELEAMKLVFPNYKTVFHSFVHRTFECVVTPYVTSYLGNEAMSKAEYLNRLREVNREVSILLCDNQIRSII